MFRKIMLLILILTIFSCSRNYAEEKRMVDWIEHNKKPIFVSGLGYFNGEFIYTLISADGKMFVSERVMVVLPDTIRLAIDTTKLNIPKPSFAPMVD